MDANGALADSCPPPASRSSHGIEIEHARRAGPGGDNVRRAITVHVAYGKPRTALADRPASGSASLWEDARSYRPCTNTFRPPSKSTSILEPSFMVVAMPTPKLG